MSDPLYTVGGLRFWSGEEIQFRKQCADRLHTAVSKPLIKLNPSWNFYEVEGPLITPREYINAAYDSNDIWTLEKEGYALRPETTASSYVYAQHLLNNGLAKLPMCIWQHGKSFRMETNDGARASELRFNEFYQCEFQCIFKTDSKADYPSVVIPSVENMIGRLTGKDTRIVDSDRLPDYSLKTVDVEVFWNNKWKEMASISIRKDFPKEGITVLEVAVGTDRLISVEGE